ncbi:TRAP transporter small permease [Desulfosporosinus sp. BICA1-9]|uniref:TRAP transporter small permease n=1 Tax=Desulfosporosinus sp. BICA1-9 TaxID=1531958 RepID=UPI000B16E073|nr:TRAP transporter small permease [Desulfosporosinus sp. BICA1-9]HBW34191.1 TRAP transporter small permease [Desulfosporosinus sp.]
MGKSLFKAITRCEEFILAYSVILMAVVLVGSVISRKVFNYSWTSAEEIGQTLTLIVTFLGIGYAAKKAKHITMSALYDQVSNRYKKILTMVITGGTSIAMFYICYYGVLYTLNVYELGRVSPSMRIPMYLIVAVVPIGFFLGAIEYGRTFIKNLKEKEIWISTEETIRDYLDEKACKVPLKNQAECAEIDNKEVK